MGHEPNHQCKVCGKKYWACNDCDSKNFISWRAVACCPEHYQAYIVLWEFGNGTVDAANAKEMLEQLGAGEWVDDSPAKELIEKILATETEKKEEPVVEKHEEVREEIHEEVCEEKREYPNKTFDAHNNKKAHGHNNAFAKKF